MASGLENIETIESPFRRFVTTIGVFPTAFTDAMTYYDCLAYLVKYMEETLIPAVNENVEAVEELQGLYIQLKAFVDNYFDNLDVQEEINNKLDQMALNGDLTPLIKAALNPDVAWTFDTVADMQASENLVTGCFAKTLGYHTLNDGGGAFYKIIAKETPTATGNININDELDAELVIDKNTTVKQFGAYGDNTHDDTSAFNAMLSALNRLIVGYGTYKIDGEINIPNNAQVNIKGKINYTGSDYCFNIDQLTYRELFIDSFESETGGMFSIAPSNAKFVSFCNFKVNYAVCAKHVFNFDATNGIITTISLDGIRWRGSTESTIKLFIDTQHASGTFLTEINIKNADIWATNSIYGVDAENKATDVEIQFNLYAVDLENSKGVSCKGKITTLGMYNCRFQEITGKQDWLSFDGYLPQVTINGLGYIYPGKIKTSNVTAKNYFITTNLTIVDQITSYNYEGGGLLAIDRFNPFIKK